MEIEGRSSYFAEDVLIGILSRLPVKSLLRFKCVSKEWRALIQSSYFTALHLKQSDSNLLLISKTIANHTADGHEFAMSLVCNEATPELNLDVSYLGCTIWPWSVSVVGSSNGLVCLLCNRDDPNGKLHKVVVWNPATKQFRCSTHETADDKSLRGFAFIDHDISDYKLVSILANKENGSTIFRAKIFTGSTNSWREVDSHGCSSAVVSYRKTSTITLNGVLYSLLWKRNYSADSLLSFNFRDEVFDVIPLPVGIAITEKNFRTLLLWKKSLAFLIEKKFFELWVMTDEPSAGATQVSWVKQFILKPSIIPIYIHGSFKDEYLFGEDIYQDLHCYNPESQRLIKLPQHDQKHSYFYDRVFNYVESLVLVDRAKHEAVV